MSGLFSSKTKTSSTQSTEVPKAFQSFLDTSLNRAMSAGTEAFNRFTGPRIAELSSNEQAGVAGAGAQAGMYQPVVNMALQAGTDMMGSNGGAPTQTQLGNFINPYVNYVLGNSLDRLQEQSDTNMTKIGSTAGMSGAFGGLRHGVLEGANLSELLKSARDLSGSTYADAFDKGMGNFFKSQANQRENIGSVMNTVGQGQRYNTQDIQNLMSTGLTERTRDQAGLDFTFSEFMREDQDDINKASFLSSIAAQYPRDLFTRNSKSETTTQDSPIKTLAGIGLAAAGIMSGNPAALAGLNAGAKATGAPTNLLGGMAGGGSSPVSYGYESPDFDGTYKKGGLVKKYADGGMVKAGLAMAAGDDPLSAFEYMNPEDVHKHDLGFAKGGDVECYSLGGFLAYNENRRNRKFDRMRGRRQEEASIQPVAQRQPFDWNSFLSQMNVDSFTRPNRTSSVNPNYLQGLSLPQSINTNYAPMANQPLNPGIPGPGGPQGLTGQTLQRPVAQDAINQPLSVYAKGGTVPTPRKKPNERDVLNSLSYRDAKYFLDKNYEPPYDSESTALPYYQGMINWYDNVAKQQPLTPEQQKDRDWFIGHRDIAKGIVTKDRDLMNAGYRMRAVYHNPDVTKGGDPLFNYSGEDERDTAMRERDRRAWQEKRAAYPREKNRPRRYAGGGFVSDQRKDAAKSASQLDPQTLDILGQMLEKHGSGNADVRKQYEQHRYGNAGNPNPPMPDWMQNPDMIRMMQDVFKSESVPQFDSFQDVIDGKQSGYAGGGRVGPGERPGVDSRKFPDIKDDKSNWLAIQGILDMFKSAPPDSFESNTTDIDYDRAEQLASRSINEINRVIPFAKAKKRREHAAKKAEMERNPLPVAKGSPLDAMVRDLQVNMPAQNPLDVAFASGTEPLPFDDAAISAYSKQKELSDLLGTPGKSLRIEESINAKNPVDYLIRGKKTSDGRIVPEYLPGDTPLDYISTSTPEAELNKRRGGAPGYAPYERTPEDLAREARRLQLERFIQENEKTKNLDWPANKKPRGYAKGGKVKSPAWQRKEGKNPEGGLNAKGRASYNRANPGKPGLKAPQPEGGSRKDSFCARMGGMKKKLTSSKTANDPDSRINKALKKWNCYAGGGQVKAFQEGGPTFVEGGKSFTKSQDRVPAEMVDPLAAIYYGMDSSAGKFQPDFQNLGRDDILAQTMGNARAGEGTITKAQARNQAPRFDSMQSVIDSLPMDPNANRGTPPSVPERTYSKARMWDGINENAFMDGMFYNEQIHSTKDKNTLLNKDSQAFGQHQYTPGTWNGLVDRVKKAEPETAKRLGLTKVNRDVLRKLKNGDPEVLKNIPSFEARDYVYRNYYLPDSVDVLKRNNMPVSEFNLYVMHHFGHGDGPKVLRQLQDKKNLNLSMADIARNAKLQNLDKVIKWNNLNKFTGKDYIRIKDEPFQKNRNDPKYRGETIDDIIAKYSDQYPNYDTPNDPSRGGETIDGGTTTFNPVKVISPFTEGGKGFSAGGQVKKFSRGGWAYGDDSLVLPLEPTGGQVLPLGVKDPARDPEADWYFDELSRKIGRGSGDGYQYFDWDGNKIDKPDLLLNDPSKKSRPDAYYYKSLDDMPNPWSRDPQGLLGPWGPTQDPVDSFYNEMSGMIGQPGPGYDPEAPAPEMPPGGPGGGGSMGADDDDSDPEVAMLKQLYRERLKEYLEYQKPKKESVFGMFGDVNEPLLKLGLSILASKGSFGEALGEAGLASLEDRDKRQMKDQMEKSEKLKEALDMRYKNAMIESMDPSSKLKLQQAKSEYDMQIQQMKIDAAIAKAELSGDRSQENVIITALFNARKDNPDYLFTKQQLEWMEQRKVPMDNPEDAGFSLF